MRDIVAPESKFYMGHSRYLCKNNLPWQTQLAPLALDE